MCAGQALAASAFLGAVCGFQACVLCGWAGGRAASANSSHPACSSHKQAAAPYQGGTKSTRTRSHSLKTVGGMAVQLPDALDHVPLVQVVVGKPVKPSLQVVLQEAPEAAGRGAGPCRSIGDVGAGLAGAV